MSIGTIKILDFLERRKTYLLVPKLYKQLFHLIQHGQVNPVILSESWQLYSNSLIISFSVFIYNVFPVTLTKAFVKQWPRLCIGFVRQLWAAEFQLQRGKCKLPNTLNCIFDKKRKIIKFVSDECLLSFSLAASWANALKLGGKDSMRVTAEKRGMISLFLFSLTHSTNQPKLAASILL